LFLLLAIDALLIVAAASGAFALLSDWSKGGPGGITAPERRAPLAGPNCQKRKSRQETF
jgi:hypothetical protein